MFQADLDGIAKSARGKQRRGRAFALDQSVGHQRRAVNQRAARVLVDSPAIQGRAQRILHRQARIARCGQGLADNSIAILADQTHVGKGAADVDANAIHRKIVQRFKRSKFNRYEFPSDLEPSNLELLNGYCAKISNSLCVWCAAAGRSSGTCTPASRYCWTRFFTSSGVPLAVMPSTYESGIALINPSIPPAAWAFSNSGMSSLRIYGSPTFIFGAAIKEICTGSSFVATSQRTASSAFL